MTTLASRSSEIDRRCHEAISAHDKLGLLLHVCLDRMGMRSYHIPNQVAEFRLSVADIADLQLCPQEASQSSIDSVWQNYQEKISYLVTLKFSDEYRQFQIETFYSGIVGFHAHLTGSIQSEGKP